MKNSISRKTTLRAGAAAIAMLFSHAAHAQEIIVRSEFLRPDPRGEIVAQDRTDNPREILSPPFARNGWSSVFVTVKAAPGTVFTVHLGQNPENSVRERVFLLRYEAAGDGSLPDKLDPVTLPYTAKMPATGALSFWFDMWVAQNAEVDRVKVEPQLNIADDWIIYPMEVRIVNTRFPQPAVARGPLPALSERADASLYGALRAALCAGGPSGAAAPQETALTVRQLIRRNALQDMALAAKIDRGKLAELLQVPEPEKACADPEAFAAVFKSRGPEWYVQFRSKLFQWVP